MIIDKIKFYNYRNLDDLVIEFPTITSFIIGENGIGKSNILNALSKIFNYGKFLDSDFCDSQKEIKIDLTLTLTDDEIGSFDEFTDPKDANRINLTIIQEIGDFYFKVIHSDSEEEVSSNLLKNVRYIYYDSLRNPKTELSFERDKGSGSFLNYLVKHYLEQVNEDDETYVNKDKLPNILSFINEKINGIKTVSRNDIRVDIDSSNLNFLNSMFQLYDKRKIELKKSGYGLQFSLLVVFSLFEKLIEVTEKAKKSDHKIETVNCILAFDEPEIHLHPFAQRALIKDLTLIANGKDEEFNKVIKELFGIISFNAQLLIVSHSDKIIYGGYENIVRLYTKDNKIKAISGKTIQKNNAKQLVTYGAHLQRQFPYFCEALFSKKVIFVEGESEFGALNSFSKTMNIDFDDYGVSVINTNGGESVIPLIKIFSLFNIDCIGIKDRDVYERKKTNGTSTKEEDQFIACGNLVLTNELNFEYEIIKAFNNNDVLFEKLKSLDSNYVNSLQATNVNKFIDKFNFPAAHITNSLAWLETLDDNTKKLFLLVAMSNIKSITFGALISENLTIDKIPAVYKKIINQLIL